MKKKYITPSVEIYSAIFEGNLCYVSPNNENEWGNDGQGGSDDHNTTEETDNLDDIIMH
ncbi:MAG: hypothetical protein HUK06_08125 [Bacteroidaceae bacterium]|nr:hypothetical protein [Bacteroidaceae bacterium]